MKVEAKKLIEMVEKGIPANEIRKELGIKSKAPAIVPHRGAVRVISERNKNPGL